MEEETNNKQEEMYKAVEAAIAKLWVLTDSFKAMFLAQDFEPKRKVCEVTWEGLALISNEIKQQLDPVAEYLSK